MFLFAEISSAKAMKAKMLIFDEVDNVNICDIVGDFVNISFPL